MIPKWSTTTLISSWPATIRMTVRATPSRGTPQAAAATNTAPYSPPTQVHHGRPRTAVMSRRTCSPAATMASAAVPTANDTSAALTGEPTAVASFALVGACRAVAPPARTTATMARREGFIPR